MKSRKALSILCEAGFVFSHTNGSHHVYKHSDGRLFSLPMGGKHVDLSMGVEAKLKRLLK